MYMYERILCGCEFVCLVVWVFCMILLSKERLAWPPTHLLIFKT